MTDTTTPTTPADTSIALSPTRTRINPNSVEVAEGQALFVTKNTEGRVRALLADQGAFEVDQTFEAILGARKAKLGTLTVVGIASANGDKVGEVPDKNLPLRLVG